MVATRHARRGTMRVYWVTTLSSKTSPTAAQISAGTDLTGDIRDINDFSIQRSTVQLPTTDAYGSQLTAWGPKQVSATPTLVLYDEGTGNSSIRSTLADGSKGWLVFCLDGAATLGERAEVWPLISMGTQDRLTGSAEAATMTYAFQVWDSPEEEATIA